MYRPLQPLQVSSCPSKASELCVMSVFKRSWPQVSTNISLASQLITTTNKHTQYQNTHCADFPLVCETHPIQRISCSIVCTIAASVPVIELCTASSSGLYQAKAGWVLAQPLFMMGLSPALSNPAVASGPVCCSHGSCQWYRGVATIQATKVTASVYFCYYGCVHIAKHWHRQGGGGAIALVLWSGKLACPHSAQRWEWMKWRQIARRRLCYSTSAVMRAAGISTQCTTLRMTTGGRKQYQ